MKNEIVLNKRFLKKKKITINQTYPSTGITFALS